MGKEKFSQTRFVYPYYDSFLNMNCLRIANTCEDGYVWFGIGEGIQNYLNECGLEIQDIEWKLQPDPDNFSTPYISIQANSIKEFEMKYWDIMDKVEIA